MSEETCHDSNHKKEKKEKKKHHCRKRRPRLSIVFIECPTKREPVRVSDRYDVTNLVSDIPGLARFTDPNLVNPWGLSNNGTGPWWVSDNGKGLSTLYDGSGTPQPLVVTIPPPVGGSPPSAPTGNAFNTAHASNPTAFVVTSGTQSGPSLFLFATEDGTLSGWNPQVNATNAILAVDRSSTGAVYKGLAMGLDLTGAPVLYATNFNAGVVELFNASFGLVRTFTDPGLVANCPLPGQCFAPFGIARIGNFVYVTYALQKPGKHDDQAGLGNGFVSVFDASGNFVRRLVSNGVLNSPWGLTVAPHSGFGCRFAGALLVGNFGDGLIHAYDRTTGTLLGTLEGAFGQPLMIEGLWAIEFGNGGQAGPTSTLFFTAGINGEADGLFGAITLRPHQIIPEPKPHCPRDRHHHRRDHHHQCKC